MEQLVKKNQIMRAESFSLASPAPPAPGCGTLREAREKQKEARNAPPTHEYSPDRSVKVCVYVFIITSAI